MANSLQHTPAAGTGPVDHFDAIIIGAGLTADPLFAQGNSWFLGSNIPGKKRVFLLYANTAPAYRAKCAEVAAKGYEGFALQ